MTDIPSDRNRRTVRRATAVVLGAMFLAVACLLASRPAAARALSFAEWLPLAQDGNPEAECQVGVAYLNGTGISQDFSRGLYWLKKSSDDGFPYARFVLADVYSRGYAGVPVNQELAYYYATLAAASSSLPEKFRDRAVKIRDASAKLLTTAQVARVQSMAAMAPLHDHGASDQ